MTGAEGEMEDGRRGGRRGGKEGEVIENNVSDLPGEGELTS